MINPSTLRSTSVANAAFSSWDCSSLLQTMMLYPSRAARSWMPRTMEVQNDEVMSEMRTPTVRVRRVRRALAMTLGE